MLFFSFKKNKSIFLFIQPKNYNKSWKYKKVIDKLLLIYIIGSLCNNILMLLKSRYVFFKKSWIKFHQFRKQGSTWQKKLIVGKIDNQKKKKKRSIISLIPSLTTRLFLVGWNIRAQKEKRKASCGECVGRGWSIYRGEERRWSKYFE